MRIGVSAAQNMGKTTLINDFVKVFPNFKIAGNSYREKAKKEGVKLNKEGDEASQKIIRDAIIDDLQQYDRKKDCVIHDRTILDYLAYTLWLNANGKVSDLFVEQQIPIVKNTLGFYDVIFFIPIVKGYDIPIVPSKDGQRELDPQYRIEMDNIFKAVITDYWKKDKRIFFPNDDCPAVIEVVGTREERIEMTKLYINPDEGGKMYEEKDSLLTDFDGELPLTTDF